MYRLVDLGHCISLSVVVDDLGTLCTGVRPAKADPRLLVYSYSVLAFRFPFSFSKRLPGGIRRSFRFSAASRSSRSLGAPLKVCCYCAEAVSRWFAGFSLVASWLFLSAVVILLFLAPEVDAMRQGISHYALTDYGLLLGFALALVGVSGILLAASLWPSTHSMGGRIGLALLIVWGLASIAAGVFPLDDPNLPSTLAGTIHNLAGLNFLLVVPAVLLIEIAGSAVGEHGGLKRLTRPLAWLVVVGALLLFVFNGPLSSMGIGGLVQRIYWLFLVAWLILKARWSLRDALDSSAPPRFATT